MTVDLVALKAANANRWAKAKLTRTFTMVAKRLVAPEAKARYQAVEAAPRPGRIFPAPGGSPPGARYRRIMRQRARKSSVELGNRSP